MQIVVKQSSGLGNQLFQYAAGKCLARRYGASLRIAYQRPHLVESHGHSRPVLLQRFAISAPVRQASFIDRLAVTYRPGLRGAARLVRAICGTQLVRQDPERCIGPFGSGRARGGFICRASGRTIRSCGKSRANCDRSCR